MKPASAKAKGRRLQNEVAALLRERYGLPESDVKPAVMGESGMDIHLSAAARVHAPLALECKNQERLNIWKALEQATEHGAAESDLTPAVIFTRNRTPVYVALELEDFLALLDR